MTPSRDMSSASSIGMALRLQDRLPRGRLHQMRKYDSKNGQNQHYTHQQWD